MKPTIEWKELQIKRGTLGNPSCVPDLIGNHILQNNLEFHLEENDEIYEGYGRVNTSYPYPQYNSYSRKLENKVTKTAVLENDYLRAEFLLELGGRLWSLWDKTQNRNLLYTNDVLRFSNLAIRNAWFSGGVEWNLGIIGHTPFTTEPLYTALLENEAGDPVLRMYEYERIRQVTYQMDFWLGEKDRFLNVRIRIVNFGEDVVPMYWWSNIAVPEYEDGRIIVPAHHAYTVRNKGVYRVDIPVVEGIDISRYKNIPYSVDYFFELEKEEPKYIMNVDKDGYGLLQMSTSRLQSRKLFSWGKMPGGDHWQEFLTENAGRYLEIQAGVGKTQYGCIPMAPHTAWEWLERYGAVQLTKEEQELPFDKLSERMSGHLKSDKNWTEMEQVLTDTKAMAKTKAPVLQEGSGYGALKNREHLLENKRPISEHLDFGEVRGAQKIWADFLESGSLAEPDTQCPPPDFMISPVYFSRLKETIHTTNKDNWYAHYQLGIFYLRNKHYEKARKAFETSNRAKENAWAYHGLAALYTLTKDAKKAVPEMVRGILLQLENLSYLKEGFRILATNRGYEELIQLYGECSENLRADGRLCLYYIQALYETGHVQEAYELLNAGGGICVDDIREGDGSSSDLWEKMHNKLYGTKGEVPYQLDFIAAK